MKAIKLEVGLMKFGDDELISKEVVLLSTDKDSLDIGEYLELLYGDEHRIISFSTSAIDVVVTEDYIKEQVLNNKK